MSGEWSGLDDTINFAIVVVNQEALDIEVHEVSDSIVPTVNCNATLSATLPAGGGRLECTADYNVALSGIVVSDECRLNVVNSAEVEYSVAGDQMRLTTNDNATALGPCMN